MNNNSKWNTNLKIQSESMEENSEKNGKIWKKKVLEKKKTNTENIIEKNMGKNNSKNYTT